MNFDMKTTTQYLALMDRDCVVAETPKLRFFAGEKQRGIWWIRNDEEEEDKPKTVQDADK